MHVLSTMDGWNLQIFFTSSKKKLELLLLCHEKTTNYVQVKRPHSHVHGIKHINGVQNAQ